ncbi:ubiquitin-like domain-containing protein [Alkaliphilus peptidifermentans]|uniref:G5 domain-containing protein n=1 Tax=Alkaliphilus peptidifermentans DSM 18978 TaxID=1120976 RepID=A0A1G5AN55_9FIRM|nr:ubiquitin-like domain-containing protein [Alkaliphilus peptidifermentans]SCX79311.1 protein of unknown function [Alkaliphilus peptidifermentans DSM 18978]
MESFLSSKRFFSKKIFIAAMTLLVLFAGISVMKLNKTIVIDHDGQQTKVSTFAGSVEAILRKEGIQLDENDKVIPQLHEKVVDGTRIIIHRAFEIMLIDAGEEQVIYTAENTIESLLNSLGIEIDELDKVEPSLQETLLPGETVRITRVEETFLVEEQEIPFQTIIKYNDSLDHGDLKTVQEGEPGFKEVKLRIAYEDGIEIAREVVEEKIHKPVINEIIEKGTMNYIVTSRGEVRRYTEVLTMEATAYDAGFESTGKNPGDPYYGITRSGTKARPGVVAVDPSVIPLGTKLYIESMDRTASYGVAVAEDTGSSIKGDRIDLFFEDRSEALKYGRRNVKVYILE